MVAGDYCNNCSYFGVEMSSIEGYTRIDQSEGDFLEYTNIKGKTIKEAFKGKTREGYDIFEIRFIDNFTLIIEEQGQVGYFKAWLEY